MSEDQHAVRGLTGEPILNKIQRQVQDLRDSLHEARVSMVGAMIKANDSHFSATQLHQQHGAEYAAELCIFAKELTQDALTLQKHVHAESLRIAGNASHVLDHIRRMRKV